MGIRIAAIMVAALALAAAACPAAADSSPYEPLRPGAAGMEGRRTAIVEAIEKARPAVVSVYAQINTAAPRYSHNPFHDDFFDRFFGDIYRRRARPGLSLGSGVIVDGAQGLLVTNEHVVRDASSITVTLTDGSELPAEIVGADARFDLAVLKVNSRQKLPELPLAVGDELMIGETVIAIGNPFGLSHTATTGVVSATGRAMPGSRDSAEALRDLIQTDASINPGNSGGPLLNVHAEVVGINTAILAGGEGLGFAIPADQVRRITAKLLRGGQSAEGVDLGLELAEAGRPRRGETGCLVLKVEPNGPAGKAGVAKGDMLMKLDGSPTSTLADYELIVASLSPGQSVSAELRRGSSSLSVKLTPRAIDQAEALELAWKLYGLKAYPSRGRLVLRQPAAGSPAERLGLQEGDILLILGGRELGSSQDLARVMLENRLQSSLDIAIQRGRRLYRTRIDRL